MKQIPLTKGRFAIVDDDDFEALSKFKWNLCSKVIIHMRKGVHGTENDMKKMVAIMVIWSICIANF